MKILSKSKYIIERMRVESYPGDPDLVRLLFEAGWLLDWKRPLLQPTEFGLVKETKITKGNSELESLVADI